MSFLLDTNVVSELRKGRGANPHVVEWFAAVDDSDVFVSVITLGELRRGIDALRQHDAPGAAVLNAWYRGLVRHYERHLLDIDLAVAEEWGRLIATRSLPTADALLGATARVHSLTVVTRDIKDMERTGVPCLNPFAAH